MNTEPQIQTTIVALPSPNAADPISTESRRHRRGKVAQLPKATREKINTMIEDGVSLTKILEQLGDEVKGITISNLSNWHLGGYKEWLRNRDYADALRDRQEKFLDAAGEDPVKLADAGMQIAATGICELLDELSRPQSKDENTSDRYARITNSMSRLARVILSFAERRDQLAKEKAAELPTRDPNKPFGDESDHRAVVDIVNRVLGLGQYRRPRSPKPTSTFEHPGEAPAITGSMNVSESPCESISDNGAPCEPNVQVSNRPTEQTTTECQLETNAQPSSAGNNTTNTSTWVPLDQRPWNWPDIPEYACMPSFPPTSEASPDKFVGG
jgi:hypothetical protein